MIKINQQYNDFEFSLRKIWSSSNFEKMLIEIAQMLFRTRSDIKDWKKPNDNDGYGVYAFWYKGGGKIDFETFNTKWSGLEKCSSSRPYKKWFETVAMKELHRELGLHIQGNSHRCFYLGKREMIFTRISDHIDGSSQTTYGLHLNRDGIDFRDQLSVGYWRVPIDVDVKCNTSRMVNQHLISYIESELRYYLSPMVGKQ
ncbi:hypothetical protein BST97_02435 [Nonlabens spongiae]|uniref:Uncharacterized protein n=1 Tax=Nonlabens spongiae TaxID=331648 RepID=A0A1W6MH86_9FLAO|nr:hypothetical protein [Nonlabens spongiae]ARN76947.1 hypothetical protein BST97_02435 [Nonlabens spongiae]